MPELPEVQTTTLGMQMTVLGLTITDVWSDWPGILRGTNLQSLKKKVVGAKFVSVERRGKNILARLSSGDTLVMHMKMTGHFMYGKYLYQKKTKTWVPEDVRSPLADKYNRFIHVVFSLSDGNSLVFCDARKFGKIEILKTAVENTQSRLALLGPEPLDKTFTPSVLTERLLRKKGSKIKQTLLDQSVLAGVGNIYADESLFLAKIHPERTVGSLTKPELNNLHSSIQKVLHRGLEHGGDSTSDYRNIYGERGRSHNTHKVYKRKGEQCTKKGCGGIIQRIVVAARGTHFCPTCQHH